MVISERHPFLGKIVTGRVHSGSVAVGDRLKVLWKDGEAVAFILLDLHIHMTNFKKPPLQAAPALLSQPSQLSQLSLLGPAGPCRCRIPFGPAPLLRERRAAAAAGSAPQGRGVQMHVR